MESLDTVAAVIVEGVLLNGFLLKLGLGGRELLLLLL